MSRSSLSASKEGFIILSLLFIVLLLAMLIAGLAPEIYQQIHRSQQRAQELRSKIGTQQALFENLRQIRRDSVRLLSLPSHFGVWASAAESSPGFSDVLGSRNKLSQAVPRFPAWSKVLTSSEDAEAYCASWEEVEAAGDLIASERTCTSLLLPAANSFSLRGNLFQKEPLVIRSESQRSVFLLGSFTLKDSLRVELQKTSQLLLVAVGDIEISTTEITAEENARLGIISLLGKVTVGHTPKHISLCDSADTGSSVALYLASAQGIRLGERELSGPQRLGCEPVWPANVWEESVVVLFGPHKFERDSAELSGESQ